MAVVKGIVARENWQTLWLEALHHLHELSNVSSNIPDLRVIVPQEVTVSTDSNTSLQISAARPTQ
jgi:hypothetical protein